MFIETRCRVNKSEYPSFVHSLHDVLCKHHSQPDRVAHSTNTTHQYRAIPVRTCSSKTITSFWAVSNVA